MQKHSRKRLSCGGEVRPYAQVTCEGRSILQRQSDNQRWKGRRGRREGQHRIRIDRRIEDDSDPGCRKLNRPHKQQRVSLAWCEGLVGQCCALLYIREPFKVFLRQTIRVFNLIQPRHTCHVEGLHGAAYPAACHRSVTLQLIWTKSPFVW